MNLLSNKRILLGVTGGIAAYKSADLVRRLRDQGADVRVVMSQGAQAFITPLTMQAVSGNVVHTELLDTEAEAGMGHIELARWGDAIVIAPATADFIARLANGEGSDLLTTLCLASRATKAVAPAMNQAMWANEATQANIQVLKSRGLHIVGPGEGSQACGDIGLGRMEEPVEIAKAVSEMFETGTLGGKKVLITAGPTREAIDPVRYISNHSSGKMGYALAKAAVEAGAQTILVSGPVALEPPERAEVIQVESALEMHAAVMANMSQADIFIGTAAVADYRPAKTETGKIKKSGEPLSLSLVENPDIIADVAKNGRAFCVGFAAETSNIEEYARKKLNDKQLDMIAANDVSRTDIGFNSEYNALSVIDRFGVKQFEEASKTQLARDLIQLIVEKLK